MSEFEKIENALYLVPTPIGNMMDITYRAVHVLREVNYIACEDTRRSGMLLKKLNIIGHNFISCHEHNEEQSSVEIVKKIKEGASCALISDAGTPLVSDPGYRLVGLAIKEGVKIVALPGANAFVPALAASGLPTDKFCFLGFAPQKKGRKTFIEKIENYSEMTVILFESPHRIQKLLSELNELYHGRLRVVVAREISKAFEEFVRGSIAEVYAEFAGRDSIKGEFVVLLNFEE